LVEAVSQSVKITVLNITLK